MTADVDQLVRTLRSRDVDQVGELFPLAARLTVFDQVTRQPLAHLPGTADRPSNGGRSTRRRPSRRRPSHALAWMIAAATIAGITVAVLTATRGASQSSVAQPGVAFHTAADGQIIATVTNPFAAESRLRAAFAKHGLKISVRLVPVSPSLVGTVIYIGNDGGDLSQIQTLQSGRCETGGGRCPIGLKIPTTFTGHGYIALGRPAKPGESYESQTSAFAPGELLHCSGLLGARVSTALPVLHADKLTIGWRGAGTNAGSASADTKPPSSNYIWDANMTSPKTLLLFTAPQPWPADPAHGSTVNRGC